MTTDSATGSADRATYPLAGTYHQLDPIRQLSLRHSWGGRWAVRLRNNLRSVKRRVCGSPASSPQPSALLGSSAPNLSDSADIPDPFGPAIRPSGLRRRIADWEDRINLRRVLRRRRTEITAILRQHGIEAVVACTGEWADMPATYLAAQDVGIPFYAYLFDDYVYQWTAPLRRRMALNWARRFMPHAAGVICPNEHLASQQQRMFGVSSTLVRNMIADWHAPPARTVSPSGPVTIVYTGSLYEAQWDSVRRLAEVLPAVTDQLARPVRLDVYTNAGTNTTSALSRFPAVRVMTPVSAEQSIALQRSADIVFLPLGFQTGYAEVIDTSAPGKMGELLASGRPLLVHAPESAFVSWYARRHDCAAVVGRPDPQLLLSTLGSIVTGGPEVALRLKHAAECALRDFAIPPNRAVFEKLVNG